MRDVSFVVITVAATVAAWTVTALEARVAIPW